MRNYLLIVLVALFAACKSKTKDEVKTNVDTSSVKPQFVTDSTPPAPPPSGKIDIETFGPLKLGQASTETIRILGEPDVKAKPVEWAADGLMHQDWVWDAKGIKLNMSWDKANPANTTMIYTITAIPPCNYKTRAGFGIGSSYAEVEAAYKKDIDPEATDATQITVGSVYGGIIFSFKNDKASMVFLGAEAE